MRSQRLDDPRLTVISGGTLPLSGHALLSLMRAVLERGVPFRFRARGWSMTPFIRDGDVITVSPLGRALPAAGDVVAFVRPEKGTLVVHRVVSRHGAAVVIRGDSAPGAADEVIPAGSLLGRVTQVEREGRSVRLGLGPERAAIAWLSRSGWLAPLRARIASWLKPLLR